MRVTNLKALLPSFTGILVAFLGAGLFLSCQTATNGQARTEPKAAVVSVPGLGFRYTPPVGLVDRTSRASREARNHAASYTGKGPELILDMSSNEADTAAEWHQLWMFIYPRNQMANLDDSAAEAKINAALAGPRSVAVSKPQSRVRGGRSFLVSEFEQKEPPLTKHARIFTTICKSQLLSFALVSNSTEQVSAMEKSMDTLDFSGH